MSPTRGARRTPAVRIAVIGAGLAGLAAAGELAAAGHEVVVWEKSRGVGGRTATRRGPDGLRFDHGAPFLHDGAAGLDGLAGLARHALVLADGSRREEVVGAGAATAPAKLLAAGLDVRSGVRVGAIAAAGEDGWALSDDAGAALGAFAAVLVTAPAPQAAALLESPAPALAERAAGVAFAPCWAAMAAWTTPLELPFTAATDTAGLAWAVAEAPKPGRAPGERWVLQADPGLTAEHLEDAPERVAAVLLDRFATAAGRALPAPAHLTAHRWRYARPPTPLPDAFLRDGTLLAAGDWCGGDTAGAALRSGRAAARALLASR